MRGWRWGGGFERGSRGTGRVDRSRFAHSSTTLIAVLVRPLARSTIAWREIP